MKTNDAKELRKQYKAIRTAILEIGEYIYEHKLGYASETKCLKLISEKLVELGIEKADLGEHYGEPYYYD